MNVERRTQNEERRKGPASGLLLVPRASCLAPRIGLAALLLLTLVSCRAPQKMADQPAYDPLEPSAFFANGMSARHPVEGTIARGQMVDDSLLYTGRIGGEVAEAYPFRITDEVMARGRERYEIFCSPCHGRTGRGDGMIVRRGYRRPPSFHTETSRARPAGHFFDAITNGFGAMPSYASQIPVADRWAITAYIRALQLSQNATVADVPEDRRASLDQPAESVRQQPGHSHTGTSRHETGGRP